MTAFSPKALSAVLDHATSEIASGSKYGTDTTKKLHGEGFQSRLIGTAHENDAAVTAKVEKLFENARTTSLDIIKRNSQ